MKNLIFAIIITTAIGTSAQNAVTVIQSASGNDIYPMGMSANGNYVTGQVGNETAMFVWKVGDANVTESNGTPIPGQSDNANARAVTNGGMVVGICPNPDYHFADDGVYSESNPATAALFDYATATWSFLPVQLTYRGNGTPYPVYPRFGSQAWDISDDETVIVGGQQSLSDRQNRIGGYWKKSGTQWQWFPFTASPPAAATRGYMAKAISGDATWIGGFKPISGHTFPITALWKWNATTEQYDEVSIAGVTTGSVEDISRNGKYATLSVLENDVYTAYLYDMEEETLTLIGAGAGALAVANNGVVGGHYGPLSYVTSPFNIRVLTMGYQLADADSAFIYTPSMGMKPLAQFFNENGITYPAGMLFKAVTGISPDGRIICGHAILNGKSVGFRAEIPEITETGKFSPTGMKAESNAYGSVTVSWQAVPESNQLTGYRIYNAATDVAIQTTAANVTSYTVSGLSDGTHYFRVTSLYGTQEMENDRILVVTMGKKAFDGYFYDAFNYTPGSENDLRNQYWDMSNNSGSAWHTVQVGEGGNIYAYFFSPGGGEYSESLTSPYFDATASDKIKLSFILSLPVSVGNSKLAVEVFDGAAWHTVQDMPANGPMLAWKPYSFDVTQYVAKKNNVRFRFRCHGLAAGEDLNWHLDNVEFADELHALSADPPAALTANYVADEEAVHITWADPNAHTLLRYMPLDNTPESGVGNAGVPFIAANMFPAADLKAFGGYKLYSLSFFRVTNPDVPGLPLPTMKWYVSQGGERLYSADVAVQNTMGWHTITLAQPITVDITKPLYYGVEVVTHDVQDWPVGVGYLWREDIDAGGKITYTPIETADGRANIFSEDGGTTWKKLSKEGLPFDLFCIRAALSKGTHDAAKENVRGYRIFRDGVNLKGDGYLSSIQNYTDTVPFPADRQVCYEIQTYYELMISSNSATYCLSMNGIQPAGKEGELKIFPVPVASTELLTIQLPANTDSGRIELYDMQGKLLKTFSANQKTARLRLNVAPGTYLIKAGKNETVKITVK